jgi:thiol-disulfide isomerase/thioredoxin
MFEQIQSGAYDLVTSSRFWMIMVVIIIFIIIAIYVYYTYVAPTVDAKFIPNSEYHSEASTKEQEQEVELLFFTVDWCPHSKKAVPIWNDLKAEYEGSPYNGYNINFIQIDGEDNPDMADKYKVEGIFKQYVVIIPFHNSKTSLRIPFLALLIPSFALHL